MPQQTNANPRSAVDRSTPIVESAWATTGNVTDPTGTTNTNDGTYTTGSVPSPGLVPLGITDWGTFNLLDGETGSLFGGVKIPAGASIVGLRFQWECQVAAGTPTLFYRIQVSGATALERSVAVTGGSIVRTIGFGTFSAGSTHAEGNTFNSRDLSTDAGSLAARADLANGVLELGARGTNSSVTTTSTFGIDFVRVLVQWVLRVDRTGGAKASATNGGPVKADVNEAAAGAKSAGVSGGQPQTQVSRGESGANASSSAGGSPHPLVSQAGGASASSTAGGSQHSVVTSTGGGKAGAKAGAGVTTVVSFAISGLGRDGQTDAPITTQNVRVDVYRTSDHAHMGRDTTDATGEYAVAIPFTGNELETFWARFYQAGTPNRFATTDEDLELIEAVIQTA